MTAIVNHNRGGRNYTPFIPHYPVPQYIQKPISTNELLVINMAWAGDKHHSMHVRQWFYEQGITKVTSRAMEWFVSNANMKEFILAEAQGLMADYNLNPFSDPHRFGTAFEAEYYTNMEFIAQYWRAVKFPSVRHIIEFGCEVPTITPGVPRPRVNMYTASVANAQFQSYWLRAVYNTESAIQHLSTYQNILLSLRLMYLSVAHFLVSFVVDR